MPTFPQKQQYSGTYFVQDRQNEEELLRLVDQDRLVTASMGGVLPEQADPSAFRRVLDVACSQLGVSSLDQNQSSQSNKRCTSETVLRSHRRII